VKPKLLFHVQHFQGLGHAVRAFALAEALEARFEVTIASGGRLPAGLARPAGVHVVDLPPVGFDANRALVSEVAGRSVLEVLEERTNLLLSLYDALRPDVIVVELFPFGRKKLLPELAPLLDRAREDERRPRVASSVRDILVTGRHDQQNHDDRAAGWLDRWFDLVLFHADPEFVSLENSWSPSVPVSVPVVPTGFVARRSAGVGAIGSDVAAGTVVVSAGGGWVGSALMTAALDAAPRIAEAHGLETTLITGPLVDDATFDELRRRASGDGTTRCVRSVPDLAAVLADAAASVSQCGYNTTLDLVRARVPAVVVPYGDDERENEQPRRAARLADLGVAVHLPAEQASGPRLAEAVAAALDAPPARVGWSLEGAQRSAALLADALTGVATP